MATRASKMEIEVLHGRFTQNVSVRATGRAGKVSLSVPTIWDKGLPLSPAGDPKTYWNAVLIIVQALILSM